MSALFAAGQLADLMAQQEFSRLSHDDLDGYYTGELPTGNVELIPYNDPMIDLLEEIKDDLLSVTDILTVLVDGKQAKSIDLENDTFEVIPATENI